VSIKLPPLILKLLKWKAGTLTSLYLNERPILKKTKNRNKITTVKTLSSNPAFTKINEEGKKTKILVNTAPPIKYLSFIKKTKKTVKLKYKK
ncbi:hypothetical protein, partial [Endozoicomonas arenosclerae]|uniref:hypothetical protein n=1 Tax=Endozoicomonas arenosclerae TaxID=1633495 RepID=UPI000A4980A0